MHGIGINDKQQGRRMAWHNLTEVNENLNLDDCWLNQWDVIPQVMQINGKDTDYKILVASDDEELVVGKPYNDASYTVVDNQTLIKMVREPAHGLPLESCGTVHDRGKVFLSFAVDAAKQEIEHRTFESYLNFGNSFDQSCPVWVNSSNICTVCFNTFSANLHDNTNKAIKLRVKHSKNAMRTIDNMPEIISAAIFVQQEFADQFRSLMSEKCTQDAARLWFNGFMTPEGSEKQSARTEGVIDRLVNLFKKGAGNEGENWADVFSAITDYYTHESSGGDNKWKQFVSSEFGTGNIKKQAAWNAIVNKDNRLEVINRGKGY